MCAVAVIAIAGAPVVSVRRFRPPLAAIIGVTLGSSFTPETMGRIPEWWPLTIAAIVSTFLMGAVGYLYLRKAAKFDPVTSYFAAMPAGVYEMTHQGGRMGGDERRISLIHAVRIFLVVMIVPIAFRWFFDLGATTGGMQISGKGALGWLDVLILALCAFGGWPAAKALRLPNPPIIGPLIASAAVHAAGIIETAPPYLLVSGAQVLLGASIGGQFIGATLSDLRRTAVHGLALIPLMLLCTAAVALVTVQLSTIAFPTLILALAPGGIAEMSLIALALNIEVMAVASHHILRVFTVNSLAVVVFRSIGKPRVDS